jgi:hypothetical protein
MSSETNHVSINLSDDEMQAVGALQQEMGLVAPDEVMHLLLRQAAQRVLVVCPTCGHSARKTAEDEASCTACMSVIHLSDGIWEVIG